MTHRNPTQLARGPLLLLAYAEGQGLARDGLLQKSGLSAAQLDDPDARIATRSMTRLWQALIDELDDPFLGLHAAQTVSVTQMGLVGYTMQHSASLGDALGRLSRYQRILSEAVRFQLKTHGNEFEVSWITHPSLVSLRAPVEVSMTLLLRAARELTGEQINPLRVEMPAAQPDDLSEYRAEFGCPMLFDTEGSSMTFAASHLELPTIAPDETLVGYLDQLAEIAASPLDANKDSTSTAVRRTLWSLLPSGRPSVWHTAREMGVSVRTLQRRLGEEGSSFSAVLDGLRRDITEELLGEGDRSVADIAFLLGYSEPSAFHRAYRRWQKTPPTRGAN